MNKTAWIVVLMVLFAVPAAFAGGAGEADPEGPVTLTYWHLWGGSRTELIDKLIADYRVMNLDVQFEVTFIPPNELQKKVVQAAGTGTLPDIVQIHSGWYDALQPQTTLTNLDPFRHHLYHHANR